jgi:hypothetical protein
MARSSKILEDFERPILPAIVKMAVTSVQVARPTGSSSERIYEVFFDTRGGSIMVEKA